MLGFFRRYQKSFMLIFLTPALLAMGITGAILSVVQGEGGAGAPVGQIGNTKWSAAEFDTAKRLYKVITNPRGDEEDAWRFLARLDAAQRCGLEISESEFADHLRTNTRLIVARRTAVKNIQKRGIKITDPRFNREWQTEFRSLIFKNIDQDDPDSDFNLKAYKSAIQSEYGIDHRQFEEHMARQALVSKFLDTVRELAVVDPADIREAYQDRHHLRTLELVEVPASRYAPKKDAKESDSAHHHVTEDQLLAYYRRRELDFDEPRRVDMQYLALRFEDVANALDIPDDDVLKAFNQVEGIAPVASFTDRRDEIVDAWTSRESRRAAQDVMDEVADALEVAQKAEAKKPENERKAIDLLDIAKGLKAKYANLLETGSTGLVEAKDLTQKREFLSGFAAERWFRIKKAGETSEVMGSVNALFALSSHEVKLARTPRYEDIKDKVLTSYVEGTPQEQRENYEAYRTTKYSKDRSWNVDLAYYKDAWFGGDHAKTKEALKKAKATAEKLMAEGKGGWKRRNKTDMDMLGREPSIKPALEVPDTIMKITEAEIGEHPLLKNAKDGILVAFPWRLTVIEVEAGWGLYRVRRTNLPEPRSFDDKDVKKLVKETLNLARGLERAEQAADEDLLSKLRHKSGDELAAALKELGLESRTTEAFDREAVSLEGVDDAGRLVNEAFGAEVEGDFEAYVRDPRGNRLFLLRVAGRQDAPADGFAKVYSELREAELFAARTEYVQERVRQVYLAAKRITKEHMAYATTVREGPGNITGLELRQIFLPPDVEITGDWLDKKAKGLAEEYLAKLKSGTPFENLVGRLSEHAATSRRGGSLSLSSKEDLADIFGNEFAEAVWPLAKGDEVALVKSTQGYHLVVMAEEKDGRKVFKHLMVSLDPKIRKLPPKIVQQAEAKSKEALNKALAALQAGQPFVKVAEEFGDEEDLNGQGNDFEIDFVTEFERAALAESLEWEQSEGEEDAEYVPEIVQVQGPDGKTYWHLFACSRDPNDQTAAWDAVPRRDRQVFHVRSPNKAKVVAAREAMIEYIRDQIRSDEGRPTWQDLVKQFQKTVPEYSDAPDAAKGGAVGMVRLEEAVRTYGDEFLRRVCFKDDGSPVAAGDRIAVFRGEKGYHLVEILKVKTSEPGDSERKVQIAELVLAGTGWQ